MDGNFFQTSHATVRFEKKTIPDVPSGLDMRLVFLPVFCSPGQQKQNHAIAHSYQQEFKAVSTARNREKSLLALRQLAEKIKTC